MGLILFVFLNEVNYMFVIVWVGQSSTQLAFLKFSFKFFHKFQSFDLTLFRVFSEGQILTVSIIIVLITVLGSFSEIYFTIRIAARSRQKFARS